MNHLFAEAMPSIDWFEAGEVVYLTETENDRLFPTSAADPHDRRTWLAGFASAWTTANDDRPIRQALADRLSQRPDLLRLLRERFH